MRFLSALFFFCTASCLLAIEVDASKKNQPEHFIDPGGSKHFSIFAGDPKRIQRANSINFGDFERKIEVTPNPLSLKTASETPGNRPSIKVVFTLKNNGKKTYILSFPNSQRYDISVKDAAGQSLYTWSEDKEFVPAVGTILVNNGDKINFVENLVLGEFFSAPTPGVYTVEAVLSNYPELVARAQITVAP